MTVGIATTVDNFINYASLKVIASCVFCVINFVFKIYYYKSLKYFNHQLVNFFLLTNLEAKSLLRRG